LNLQNALDLDQAEMERQLARGTNQAYVTAQRIYEEGAFSKSVATVTLNTALSVPISIGTDVTGTAVDEMQVDGKVYSAARAGDQTLRIQYNVNSIQVSHLGCQVGANPNPLTDGCFAQTGTLNIAGFGSELAYTYNPEENNDNERTIQKFSTDAEQKMNLCENCPYSTFMKFYEYYGRFDYADHWVSSAFAGGLTSFANGDADFGTYEGVGRVGKFFIPKIRTATTVVCFLIFSNVLSLSYFAEAIKKGTAFLNVWMYVILEMEDALDHCVKRCDINTDCFDDPVKAWDGAVAFYTGSLELQDGSGTGFLLYDLADKRCANFNTCGDLADSMRGTSHVSIEIFRQFQAGLRNINQGECAAARANKESIEQLMAIPLVQGTLRYAFSRSELGSGEKAEAEGATFAAAVLPIIHACDEDDAAIIYDNMRVGSGVPNFKAVKEAFERNYACMNIRCGDVGGVYDSANLQYFQGTEPCGSSGNRMALKFGLMATLLLGVTMLF
jgi:hypothetical protein